MFNNLELLKLVIISCIVMTFTFDSRVILNGKIECLRWLDINCTGIFKLEHAFLILALVLTLPHLSKLPMGQGVHEVLTRGSPDKSEDFPTCSSSRLLWFLFDGLKCCLPLKKINKKRDIVGREQTHFFMRLNHERSHNISRFI